MAILSVRGLHKMGRDNMILNHISFTIESGQQLAIAGETGSGKSSLLRMIAGMDQPDSGWIEFDGYRVRGAAEKLLPGHPGVAYLSQHYELHNNYFVKDILSFQNDLSASEAENLYRICKIDQFLNRKTAQLSGGERQRIALAKLLTSKPKLLLLDEPFSNLDWHHKTTIKSVLAQVKREWPLTMIMVSHEPEEILSWADRVMLMKEGSIVQDQLPHEVFFKPVSQYAAGLLGPYNLINPVILQRNGLNYQPKQKGLVRPGNIVVVEASAHSNAAIVSEIHFEGNRDLVTARLKDFNETLIFYSRNSQFVPGENIHLLILPEPFWLI